MSPKDHKHAAGVVCVAMSAEQVTRLFAFAEEYGLTQDEAMARIVECGLSFTGEEELF
jgi:phenylalanine-4-hydroxylase